MTYIQHVSGKQVWANVRDGGESHLVLTAQLLTEQAALCGYEPPTDHEWVMTEGKYPRPTSGQCKRCKALAKGGGK